VRNLAGSGPGAGQHDLSEDTETVVLWRTTGPEELALVEASGWREWRPCLAEQPIFYPVLTEEYAAKIVRDWSVPAPGSGNVTRFKVRKSFLDNHQVRQAGGQYILEYWIPAEDPARSERERRRAHRARRGVSLAELTARQEHRACECQIRLIALYRQRVERVCAEHGS
jgi:hypothetical protein